MKKALLFTSVFFSFAMPAFAASPQEDLVSQWLVAMSHGLEVKREGDRFDPSRQAVVIDALSIGGGEKDFVTLAAKNIVIEDPYATAGGRFAAHRLSAEDLSLTIRVDLAAWFPGFIELLNEDEMEEDALEDEENGAEDGQAGSGASASTSQSGNAIEDSPDAKPKDSIVFTYRLSAEKIFYDRLETPMQALSFGADMSIVDKAFAIAAFSLQQRVAYAEAVGITIETTPDVSGGDLPEDMAASLRQKQEIARYYVASYHDGRIERFGFEDMKQEQATPEGLQTLTVRQGEGGGYDVQAILDVLNPAAYKTDKGDGLWRSAVQYIDYRDMGIHMSFPKNAEPEGEVAFNIGTLKGNGFRVRQTEKPLVPILQRMIEQREELEDDPLPFVRDFLPAFFNLYGFDALEVGDIALRAPIDGTGKGKLSLDLRKLGLTKVDSDGIGTFGLRDLSVKFNEQEVGALERFSINDVRFGSWEAFLELIPYMEQDDPPPPPLILDAITKFIPAISEVELAGLNITIPEGEAKGKTISLERFSRINSDFFQQFPLRSEVHLKGLSIPVEVMGDNPKAEFQALGYEDFALSLGATVFYDREKDQLHLQDLTVQGKEMGSISADLVIGGLHLSQLIQAMNSDNPQAIEAFFLQSAMQANLVSSSVTVANQGLFERLLDMAAKDENQSPEALKKRALDELERSFGELKNPALKETILSSVRQFMDKPQSFKVSANPPAPLPWVVFAGFSTPLEIDPKLIGLEIKSNQ